MRLKYVNKPGFPGKLNKVLKDCLLDLCVKGQL